MNHWAKTSRFVAVAALAALITDGCATINNFYGHVVNNTAPQQVSPDEFMQRQSTADKSETLSGDTSLTIAPVRPVMPANPPPLFDPDIVVDVRAQTQPTTETAEAAAAAEATAATEPAASSGEFMSLGGVVAEVNGTPIYINKVLDLVWPALHNDARTMDADHFELAAEDEITRQIDGLEADELLYAAAERSLDNSDQKLVTDLTTAFRQRLVTQAGGSLQVARQQAAASGEDFDQIIRDQHRRYMIDLYQQRKFAPLAEPSADDLRSYYRQNVDKLFTEHPAAVFDLLKIDPAGLGGDSELANRKLAFAKAKEAHDRAAAGANFSTLFAEYNNDPGLNALTNGTGSMGTVQRGTFSIKEIEDAVWKLQPGQVTDVIEVDGMLYVARLESRKEGRVRPFEDEDVQSQISQTIRQQRMGEYVGQDRERLLSESIRSVNPQMFQTALDIAMQSYHVWMKK